ncbi:MAG: hypothetical protein ACK4UN_19685 [Limisphaerales bacterium]
MNAKYATGLLLLGALASGCINVQVTPKQSSPVVYVPGQALSEADSLAIAEIDAAFSLAFDNSKVQMLSPVAQRPELSPLAQVHLVRRTLKDLSFENSKVHLLKLLIQNPSFSKAAKQEILQNLKKLSFDSNKTFILKSLEDRGTLSS